MAAAGGCVDYAASHDSESSDSREVVTRSPAPVNDGVLHFTRYDPRNSRFPRELPRVIEGADNAPPFLPEETSGTALTFQSVSAGWANTIGNTGTDLGVGVAVDSTGSIVQAGYFQNSLPFSKACAQNGISTTGQIGLFVAKYSSTGACTWAFGGGTTIVSIPIAVAVDSSNNIYISGLFSGTLPLPGFNVASVGGYDAFVFSVTSAGALRWYRTFGSAGDEYAYDVKFSPSSATPGSAILVTGEFANSIDFGAGTMTSAGGQDVFTVSLNPSSGATIWQRRAGGTGYDTASGVATDSVGNVFVTGAYSGSVSFGGTTRTSAGGTDAYVIAYGYDGSYILDRVFGGASDDGGTVAAIDGQDVLLLSGHFSGNVDFGSGFSLSGNGVASTYVGKFAGAGLPTTWINNISATSLTEVQGLYVDASGNAIVSGQFTGTGTFGSQSGKGTPTMATPVGGADMYFLEYASLDGKLMASATYGGTGDDQAIGIALTSSGNLIATGGYSASATFGKSTLTSKGSTDSFLMSLSGL